ncbi:MAG: GNAT family N-acetyltransferase [Gammaproteobacteria bacterium]|nr:GNAT family N-acetyltransferase [Gammaproteobacteria bacterium]
MQIRIESPRCAEVSRLLAEHLADMALHSPPESIHALDVDGLCVPEVTFWAAWEAADLLGCGALYELSANHAEIKSMRTAQQHRRKGVAGALLMHIVNVAHERRYSKLSLETGSMAAFAPARALYERSGFEYCGPFGNYVDDPNSVFMTMAL